MYISLNVLASKYAKSDAIAGTDTILKKILYGAYASNVSKSSNYTQKALCNGVYSDDQSNSSNAQLAQEVGAQTNYRETIFLKILF